MPGKELTREKAEAVAQLLNSQDLVQVLLGKSGTGKSTTLKELDAELQKRGRQLLGFAPTAKASRGVLRSKGFATADTLANLLAKPELQAAVRGNVLMIDEAGLAGTRALRQVFDLVKQQREEGYDTRILLVGDPQQHRGVPRGQVLTILPEQAGLVPARLNTIYRQQDPAHLKAVELASVGKAGEAFDQLDQHGFIREIEDAGERYRALAKEYADTLDAGLTAMILSPTHAEGRAVSAAVREELRARGRLGAEDHQLVRYESRGLTEAQRKEAALYQPGDMVQWSEHAPGFRKGEKVTVIRREGEQVRVAKADGTVAPLPLELANRFELYRTDRLAVADNEKLRITRNGYARTPDGKQHRLNNGELLTVHLSPKGELIDQRGWVISAEYGHLAHGVVTSHASQGDEADVPFLAQSGASRGASSSQQWYVSTGRGIKAVRVYTDDKDALRAAVARSEQNRTAAEVWQASQRQRQAEHRAGWEQFARRQRKRRSVGAVARERLAAGVRTVAQAFEERRRSRGLGHAQS
jgi:hypothetical protein